MRSVLFWLHLAAGVIAGVAIATMSATGALLALQPQILERLEHGQRTVAVPPNPQRLAPSILLDAAVHQEWPDAVTLTMFADPAASALVSVGRGEVRYIDPYSGAVLGDGARGARRLFQWITEFHRWFAAPVEWRASARAVTGWSTLAFVVLIASGVVLWIPRRITGALIVRSVIPRWPSTAQARHFNWHTVAGFWCAPVLLVLALSGVVLGFPWANRLLNAMAGTPAAGGGRAGGAGPRRSRTGREASPRPGGGAGSAGGGCSLGPRRTADALVVVHRHAIQARTAGPLSFTITDATHWNRFSDRSSRSRAQQARCCAGSPTAASPEVSAGAAGHGSRTRANSEA